MSYTADDLIDQGGKYQFNLRRVSDGCYITLYKDFGPISGGGSGDLYDAASVSDFMQELIDAFGEMTSFEVYGDFSRKQEYRSSLTPTP